MVNLQNFKEEPARNMILKQKKESVKVLKTIITSNTQKKF